MFNITVDFVGGALDGQQRASIDEVELVKLGYRSYFLIRDKDGLKHSIAVPIEWPEELANWTVLAKMAVGAFVDSSTL